MCETYLRFVNGYENKNLETNQKGDLFSVVRSEICTNYQSPIINVFTIFLPTERLGISDN